MSQKINPISFRLGLLQVWNETIAIYNKKGDFRLLSQKNVIENYVKSLFVKTKICLGGFVWIISPRKVVLIITYVNLNKSMFQLQGSFKQINNAVRVVFKSPSFVYLVKHNSWSDSAMLVKAYLTFSGSQTLPLNSVLRNSIKVIHNQLGNKKLVYTSRGPLELKLTGFRFKLSGRFGDSRNQMTKTIKFERGSLPMPNLNSYSEYSHTHIYTKSGVCGLGVWLTYSNQHKAC